MITIIACILGNPACDRAHILPHDHKRSIHRVQLSYFKLACYLAGFL